VCVCWLLKLKNFLAKENVPWRRVAVVLWTTTEAHEYAGRKGHRCHGQSRCTTGAQRACDFGQAHECQKSQVEGLRVLFQKSGGPYWFKLFDPFAWTLCAHASGPERHLPRQNASLRVRVPTRTLTLLSRQNLFEKAKSVALALSTALNAKMWTPHSLIPVRVQRFPFLS